MNSDHLPIRAVPSRLRATAGLRRLVRETRVHPAMLVLPLFVAERAEDAGPIASMPGVQRVTARAAAEVARRAHAAGLGGVLVFGVPAERDAVGSSVSGPDSVVARAIRSMKEAEAGLPIIADVCLCQYTDHGHCGVLRGDGASGFDHGATLRRYTEAGVSYARAGADLVAPSGRMDGQVSAIRLALDAAGHTGVAILSYAVKHASALYGPFREAAGSSPISGDRRSHQLPPSNAREHLAEAGLDEAEGADALMVKPAMTNLDTLARLRTRTGLPLAAYHVSGEYAAIAAAAERGWLDRLAVATEQVTAIVRAGAGIVVTYFALELAERLRADGQVGGGG